MSTKLNNYNDVLQYMFAKLPMYHRVGKEAYKKDLTNIKLLCEKMGQPQSTFKSVHVGGTNGKGTVSHIIAGGLQINNYKTGLYTSPHYKDFRERIKIDGKLITKKYIINFIKSNFAVIEEIGPSFFEITVAMAFCWFRDNKVDVAVIEVGLGGRLDSTNIVSPILSVITNISFDHMDMLGNTLPEIAAEKAGIIKNSTPVVIGEHQKEVAHVFKQKSIQMKAKLIVASNMYSATIVKKSPKISTYSINHLKTKNKVVLKSDLISPYHHKNIVTSFVAMKEISKLMPFDVNLVTKSFHKIRDLTYYIGRWQYISTDPKILIDSAHNEAGLNFVTKFLEEIKCENLHIVLGFVKDKDLEKILPTFPNTAKYYFAKANIPRGLDANDLKKNAKEYNLIGNSYASIRRALAAAKRNATKKDFIFVGGSIFTVAEVI